MRIIINKKDVVWNYIGTIFQMGINYLLLPILLIFFDADTLGLWYVYMNLANVATLFVFGFSPTFARNIAYCWSGAKTLDKYGASAYADIENSDGIDSKLFGIIMSTCRCIYLIVALLGLVIMSSIGTGYIFYIAGYMLKDSNLILSWIILLVAIFLNLYYGYYISALSGIGAIANRSKAHIYSNLIRIVLTALFLYIDMGLIGACLAYLIYGFVLRFICKYFFDKDLEKVNLKNYKANRDEIRNCLSIIWPNSWKDGMVSLSDYLCTQAGTIVSSLFLPLPITGMYSLCTQLVTAVAKISRSYQIAKIPSLQSAFISADKDQAKKINAMCITSFVTVYILGIIVIVVIACPIIELIKPGIHLDRIWILMIALAQFMIVHRNCYASFLSTTNKVDYWKSFVFSGTFAVMLSVAFLRFFDAGIVGIITATIISEAIYNAWHWPMKVNKELGTDVLETYNVGIKEFIKKE